MPSSNHPLKIWTISTLALSASGCFLFGGGEEPSGFPYPESAQQSSGPDAAAEAQRNDDWPLTAEPAPPTTAGQTAPPPRQPEPAVAETTDGEPPAPEARSSAPATPESAAPIVRNREATDPEATQEPPPSAPRLPDPSIEQATPSPIVPQTAVVSPPSRVTRPPIARPAPPSPPLVTRNIVRSVSPIAALCQRIGSKLGSVSNLDCANANFQDSGRRSVDGAALIWKEYPPLPEREPMGRVLMLGGIHGDELSSVSIVFKWMQKLDQYHSGLFHWRVAPLVNPDGLLRPDHQRMNANGVDLNRNFPTLNWETEAPAYWESRNRAPRRYPGPSAGSEPETRWLIDEIENFNPDVIVQLHAPYGIVDYDGPRKPPKQLGQLHLYLLGVYPGSLGNYGGMVHGIPVVTIELPLAGSLPDEEEISRMWIDLVAWLRNNMAEMRLAEAQ